MSGDLRALELAVVRAAMKDHRGCAPETCGGTRLDPCPLSNAIDSLISACPDYETPTLGPEDDGALRHELADAERAEAAELVWVGRTWADVVEGDRVRIPGTEHTADVSSAEPLTRHVDPRTGTSGYNPPIRLDHDVMAVRFAHESFPRDMDPARAIDIEMTRGELAALKTLSAARLSPERVTKS